MRSVNDLLSEYGASHQDPTNKRLHWICVPPIVLSALGFLWCVPVPAPFPVMSPWLNWATLGAAASLIYYLLLSPALAAGAFVSFVVLLGVTHELARLPWPLWLTSLVIFVIAWIGQFIGHKIEGRKPSFLTDMAYLLIGPAWIVAKIMRRMSIAF